MKKYYSISIPKPCHEDWNAMSQSEKGKFCSSCSKTVIDFSKMETSSIQDFIHQNKNNNICGHFKQTQLDSINLQIPSQVLTQYNSFHKIFLLALLIVMGTSVMNCTNKKGNSQKIDSVEVVDTLKNNKTLNILEDIPIAEEIDSITKLTSSLNKKQGELINEIEEIDGEIEIMTVGDIDINEPPIIPEPTGIIIYEEDIVVGMLVAEYPPEFLDTPTDLSKKEKRDYLSKEVSKIISENFNTNVCIDLKGKQRVHVQFQIDSLGVIQNIKARAPHPLLEKEAIRTIELLPDFIPAKQNGKPIQVVYTLPIIFNIE